jgi:hypothetical protein
MDIWILWKFLINKGSINNSQKSRAFILASKNGHFQIVKILVENSVDNHSENDYALRISYEKNISKLSNIY